MSDGRKKSVYIPASMLKELQREMVRLDRSLSWIVQRCIKLALPELRKMPSVDDDPNVPDDEDNES